MRVLAICITAPIIIWGLLFPAFQGAAQEKLWTVYRDAVHGCRLYFPHELFSASPSSPGEAKRFTTADRKASFEILGVQNRPDWTAFDIRQKFLGKFMPGVIVHQHISNRSLTLFGYRGETAFHNKVILSDDLNTACIFDISYPLPRRNAYGAIAQKMLLSMHVGNN
jgi:hypothetical protein